MLKIEHKVTENLKSPILVECSFVMLCSILLDIGVTPVHLPCMLAPPLSLCGHTPTHRKS